MKSLLTKTATVFFASFILCTVAQAQKTSAAFHEKVDFSSYNGYEPTGEIRIKLVESKILESGYVALRYLKQ